MQPSPKVVRLLGAYMDALLAEERWNKKPTRVNLATLQGRSQSLYDKLVAEMERQIDRELRG